MFIIDPLIWLIRVGIVEDQKVPAIALNRVTMRKIEVLMLPDSDHALTVAN